MNTLNSLNAYQSHDLSIMMKTSSGDVINLDMSNSSALSYKNQQDENGSKTEFSFASNQNFQFKVDSNGIDAQDKKEIEAFLEIAQPYIDNFMSELSEDQQKSPLNNIAQSISQLIAPAKEENEAYRSQTKESLVNTFDKSLDKFRPQAREHDSKTHSSSALDKLFEQSQKLLEKVLEDFNKAQELLLYG